MVVDRLGKVWEAHATLIGRAAWGPDKVKLGTGTRDFGLLEELL